MRSRQLGPIKMLPNKDPAVGGNLKKTATSPNNAPVIDSLKYPAIVQSQWKMKQDLLLIANVQSLADT